MVVAELSVGRLHCTMDIPALQLCQHLTPGFVTGLKLWLWVNICSKVVALMETFMWWQLLRYI